jgi:heme/copper-type cytochrome/quinol oxidase subunit 2
MVFFLFAGLARFYGRPPDGGNATDKNDRTEIIFCIACVFIVFFLAGVCAWCLFQATGGYDKL